MPKPGKNAAKIAETEAKIKELEEILDQLQGNRSVWQKIGSDLASDPSTSKKPEGKRPSQEELDKKLSELKSELSALKALKQQLVAEDFRDSEIQKEKVSSHLRKSADGDLATEAFLKEIEADESIPREDVVARSKEAVEKMKEERALRDDKFEEERELSNEILGHPFPYQEIFADEGKIFGARYSSALKNSLESYLNEPIDWDLDRKYDNRIPSKAVMAIKEVKRDIDYAVEQGLLDDEWKFELKDIRSGPDLSMVKSRIDRLSKKDLQEVHDNRISSITIHDLDAPYTKNSTEIIIRTKK